MSLLSDEHVAAALSLVMGVARAAEPVNRVALKRAFRRRAHEMHPDKAVVTGIAAARLASDFRALRDAYELLSSLLRTTGTIPPTHGVDPWRARQTPGHPRAGHPTVDGRHARGAVIPRRRLRFAQYLFFSGIIDETTIAEAVTWQRCMRPRCGDIAVRLRYLTRPQVERVLAARVAEERFGEAAVRLQSLSHAQVLTVLSRQRRFDRPIGRFFVERSILSAAEVRDLLAAQWAHNLACARDTLRAREEAATAGRY